MNACLPKSNQPDMFSKVEAMRSQAKEKGVAEAEARKSKADENRRLMPTVTAWIDETREVFGDDVKVAYAKEGGVTLGKPVDGGIKLSETMVGTFASVANRIKK